MTGDDEGESGEETDPAERVVAELGIEKRKEYREYETRYVYFAPDVSFSEFETFVVDNLARETDDGIFLRASKRQNRHRKKTAWVLIVDIE
jgi:hypothetical protein